ncbi:MAG: 50S ribosomal protein L18 [Planctomycetota bacterium]
MQLKEKRQKRIRRHRHVRKKIFGTATKPRLNVFRSINHLYTQLINDTDGQTLCSLCTLSPEVKKELKSTGNITAAKAVGRKLAELALQKGIKEAVFDRGSFPYHGRIKALAEAVRAGGLKI